MNESPEEIREKLRLFCTQLKKLSFPSSPISIDIVEFVTSSFDAFLSGRENTLDAAFHVTPKRGAPEKSKEHEEIARTIFGLRIAGKSWNEISEELAIRDCSVTDEKSQKRIFRKFKVMLMAEEAGVRLLSADLD